MEQLDKYALASLWFLIIGFFNIDDTNWIVTQIAGTISCIIAVILFLICMRS